MLKIGRSRIEESYDVVIVGAGPAGATAGFILGNLGYKVLLIDKERFPRNKPCGGLLTNKTLELLDRVFSENLESLVDKDVIDYVSNKWKIHYQFTKLGKGQLKTPFCYAKRKRYDDFFLNKTKDVGADVLEGEKVIDIVIESNKVITESGRELKAEYILGADGANSIIRRKLSEKELIDAGGWKQNLGVAMQQKIDRKNTELGTEGINLHFGIIEKGYAWVFPYSDEVIAGVGGVIDKNRNMKESFKSFLEGLGLNFDSDKSKSHLVTLGNFLKKPTYKNILLVGDAGGLMNPITGEGIFYAHRSGVIAANTIHEKEKNEDLELVREYTKTLNHKIISELSRAKRVRNIWAALPQRSEPILLKAGLLLMRNFTFEMIHGKGFLKEE
ncbi:MAG: NAD(P)/FAD-dependent oxidoreductase [Thermoplasmatota archaeon]